ncbi:MAG: T9SS type A sorting domain-containing protein [Bacteroidales bacterium]|nr:T9SS type A sorting domain-containing protein [Bacteroidales bacterium]MCF8455518.1 T9SS type A sorting domain-containing protein [Bacteroidales bacterium]
MMTRIPTILFSVFLFTASNSFAQYLGIGSNWYFGDQAGLTWTTLQCNGDPMYLMDGGLATNEGVASMSDNQGNLLFYTDGVSVWNKLHTVMPNSLATSIGGELAGDLSSTQSALIVPKPLDPNTYYIFTTDADLGTGGLAYSRVDMLANGGLGDIAQYEKNVPLFNPSTEKIMAVNHSNGSNIWVITHQWNNNQFNVYLVSSLGVQLSAPIISNVGALHSGAVENARGYMKASPGGGKVCLGIEGMNIWELFSFNNMTGQLSNAITLSHPSNDDCYGVEFSADEQFLYGSEHWGVDLHQWDVSLPSSAAILASHQIVGTLTSTNGGALQLGPDSKIYHARNNTLYLGRINEPSLPGTLCNYVDQAILLGPDLATARNSQHGLPFFLPSYYSDAQPHYETNCDHDTVFFETPNPQCIDSAFWNFNYPSTNPIYHFEGTESEAWFIYSIGGIYTVELITQFGNNFDTFYTDVNFSQTPHVNLGPDVTLCDGDSLIFDLSYNDLYAIDGSCDYLWEADLGAQSFFDSSANYLIDTTGTYYVTVYNDPICGSASDTINVVFNPTPIIDFGGDTINPGLLPFVLNPNSTGTSYQWSDGTSDTITTVYIPGQYSVTITNVYGCVGEGSVLVFASGIEENGIENHFLIFPNPTQNKLYISFDRVQVDEIQIYSSSGKQISHFTHIESTLEVNTQHLSEGIYFVKILTKDNEVAIKSFSVIR